jgi:hypothetical protein
MTHHDKHDHQHHDGKPKSNKNWIVVAAVILMLGAMLIYVLSDDEAIQPGGPPEGAIESAPVEAAP